MSLREERLARQQARFRNKGGLSKYERAKPSSKLVLTLNSLIPKSEHVEGRVPPPQSLLSPPANSSTATQGVTVPATHSLSPAISASNPLLAPPTNILKQRATKPKASSSRPRKPQPTKKNIAPAPTKEACQSDDDDELALIVTPAPILAASTRKSKHASAAKFAPTQTQGSTKAVDDRATEILPVAKKKVRSKPSQVPLKRAEVEEMSSPKELSSEPPRPKPKRPKPKKKEPTTVQSPVPGSKRSPNGNSLAQRSETEGGVKDCATEAPPNKTQKRKARAEELPAMKPKVSGHAAKSQSGTMVSCPVVEDDGDENEATQGPPKKRRRRVLIDQPCTWDAEDQAPRRVLKLPGHK